MNSELVFGLDLGTDNLKVSFCFAKQLNSSEFEYGKVSKDIYTDYVRAYACYNKKLNKWFFGEEAFEIDKIDYEHFVSINSLLSLLNSMKTIDEYDKNSFNTISSKLRGVDTSFSTLDGSTPKTVVENFFHYVIDEYLDSAFKEISNLYKLNTTKKCSIALNDKASDIYSQEFIRIINTCRNLNIPSGLYKTRRSSEAIAIYAFKAGVLNLRDRYLIINIGESKLTSAITNGFNMEKYLSSIDLGGVDFDKAIFSYIENNYTNIDVQSLTYYQEFLLNERIESSKIALSRYNNTNIVVEGQTNAQIPLSRSDLRIIFEPVYSKIATILKTEISKSGLIKAVIIVGGASSTYGLIPYISNYLGKVYPLLKVISGLDFGVKETNRFSIGELNSIYAISCGVAMLATGNIKALSVCPLSYGILIRTSDWKSEFIKIIIKKNTTIPFPTRIETSLVTKPGIATSSVRIAIYSTDKTEDIFLYDCSISEEEKKKRIRDLELNNTIQQVDLDSGVVFSPSVYGAQFKLYFQVDENGLLTIKSSVGNWIGRFKQLS
jgi:hypothetical protein